jgi:hypothetical protein
MASSKLDFTDFRNFPGNISKKEESKGFYSFPCVYSVDSMGRRRSWMIWVRLIVSEVGIEYPRKNIDWDITADIVVPILNKYLNGDNNEIPNNVISQMWTVQGIVGLDGDLLDSDSLSKSMYKSTRSIPTYITIGKNIGKKNETNVLTQALIGARSKYLKKMKCSSERSNTNRFFPVAIHKYSVNPKDDTKHLRLPIAVQRKLDGGRACAFYDIDKKQPVMYTRKLEDVYGNKHILKELLQFFNIINKSYPGIYLDGEMYKHGTPLQTISGLMRKENDSKTPVIVKLEYHIFDIFFPLGDKKAKNMPYSERLDVIKDLFKITRSANISLNFIIRVETYIVDTFVDENNLYLKFLKEKYEGSIVHNIDSPYEFGINKEIRTYQTRKKKPRYTSEYEIIGYKEGTQGKDKGAIIWVLKTGTEIIDLNGNIKQITPTEFTSTPVGINYKERYSLFSNMTADKFKNEYKGQLMVVEYDDLSKSGIPLRAKTRGIRTLD